MIAAPNDDGATRLRRQYLRIRRFGYRGRVDDDHAELSGKMIDDHFEYLARQQFLRIGWKYARREHVQPELGMDAPGYFPPGAPGQKRGQSHRIVDIEQAVLARVAHIRVDEQCPLSELREHGRKICREPAPPLAAFGTGHGQHFALGTVEPTKNQLAAQCAQGLDRFALWLVSRDDIVGYAVVPASRQDRIVVLQGDGGLDVDLGQPLQLYGSVAETQAVQVGKGLDFLHVLDVEPALFNEYGPNGAAAVLGHLSSFYDPIRG